MKNFYLMHQWLWWQWYCNPKFRRIFEQTGVIYMEEAIGSFEQ